MKNPLAVFTGAALATLAALTGLNMTDWPGGASDAQKPAEAASQARNPAAEAAATQAPEQKPAAAEAGTAPDKAPEKPAEMAALPTPGPPDAQAKPELDTVRVESDGQAVVAGRAEPGAEIALKLGEEVIGKGLASPDGSWVVVPDQPLPKGAHEITVEQKTADSAAVTGEQSIAVAIPEKPGQQAMVALTEPGAATQVLQAGGYQEQASLSETAQSGMDQPKPAEKPAETAEKPAESQEPAATLQKSPDAGDTAGQAAEAAPETTVAKSEVPDPVAPPPETPPPAGTESAQAARDIPLGLDAVDYNDKGDIIFSGRAKPGTAVRLYVDNRAVGDAMVDAGGRWTFAGKDIIAPGTHDLRADQIDKAGKVIARVELPFLRENAEAVAALNAGAEPEAELEAEPEKAEPPAASETQPEAEPPAQQPETEQPSQTATAQPQAVTAEPEPEVAAGQPAPEPPARTAAAQPQTTTAEPAPQTAAAEPEEQTASETAAAGSRQASGVEKTEAQVSAAAPGQPVAAGDETEGAAAMAAADEAAKAIDPGKPRSGKVVIQPGNNLWKLSRVIYGRGIDYTVIYQANRDQIRDPDRIYPGQIFAIPGAMPPETIDPERDEPLTGAEGGTAQ
ncbi:MAG: LysM peptidoglycan-binding domain-containing protein [Parvibaculaceae bacterium]